LEAGITIVEAAFSATNSTGSTTIGRLERAPYAGGTGVEIAAVSFPSTTPDTVDLRGVAIADVVVSETDTYVARLPTSGAAQWIGFRLGFIPFGFGYTPIAP